MFKPSRIHSEYSQLSDMESELFSILMSGLAGKGLAGTVCPTRSLWRRTGDRNEILEWFWGAERS
ncbi:hypothetical protein HanXRQr2_Chr03g0105721 [Helianthus annuus]|uniref:Uncharacterized protein n=1 Tax=Helianthus annuus TaxID=4232 RepID=A0A9K3JEJ9_HELAN|nr:hypothetical protein HanXRQr2_Chr03g0105721 [Helianthus annuus]KAJ0600330.1 hypothetical protein HanIR_Chr03g0115361 [Helianthus annuus]KAJ0943282.1 hypothetical protein HanPSC8_Chr03g0102291 [Helianthus annuus]